jgi:lipopolysaccharide export system protein LptC
MSLAPLTAPHPPQHTPRVAETVRQRPPANVGHRHFAVAVTKRLLPLVALVLLTMVVLWPEYQKEQYVHVFAHGIEPVSGQLTDVRYSGVDVQDRPYTVTAATARQANADRIDLVEPKADTITESGTWVMVQSRQGSYGQRSGQLDLFGNVMLYREDGLTLVTEAATMDFKAGVASGTQQVHVEGPFGTLDAQGFSVDNTGRVVQFAGPGRLVLNGEPE